MIFVADIKAAVYIFTLFFCLAARPVFQRFLQLSPIYQSGWLQDVKQECLDSEGSPRLQDDYFSNHLGPKVSPSFLTWAILIHLFGNTCSSFRHVLAVSSHSVHLIVQLDVHNLIPFSFLCCSCCVVPLPCRRRHSSCCDSVQVFDKVAARRREKVSQAEVRFRPAAATHTGYCLDSTPH